MPLSPKPCGHFPSAPVGSRDAAGVRGSAVRLPPAAPRELEEDVPERNWEGSGMKVHMGLGDMNVVGAGAEL